MRVYVANSNTMMYDRHSAFGPPVDDGSDVIKYTESSTAGTQEEVVVTFEDPASYSLASITLEDDLPRMTIVDGFSTSHEVYLYDSAGITPTSSPGKSYIDISVFASDTSLATEFKTQLENSDQASR